MTPGPAQHTVGSNARLHARNERTEQMEIVFFSSARPNIIRVVSVCDGAQNAFVCKVKKKIVSSSLATFRSDRLTT